MPHAPVTYTGAVLGHLREAGCPQSIVDLQLATGYDRPTVLDALRHLCEVQYVRLERLNGEYAYAAGPPPGRRPTEEEEQALACIQARNT